VRTPKTRRSTSTSLQWGDGFFLEKEYPLAAFLPLAGSRRPGRDRLFFSRMLSSFPLAPSLFSRHVMALEVEVSSFFSFPCHELFPSGSPRKKTALPLSADMFSLWSQPQTFYCSPFRRTVFLVRKVDSTRPLLPHAKRRIVWFYPLSSLFISQRLLFLAEGISSSISPFRRSDPGRSPP